jgi:hypothetical protein
MYTTIRSSLLWDVMQCRLVFSYHCLGTTYWTHLLKASPMKTGLMGCPATLATKYQSMLHNIPAGQISHLHHSGSLQSYAEVTLFWIFNYPDASHGFWSSEMCSSSAGFSGSWHFEGTCDLHLKGYKGHKEMTQWVQQQGYKVWCGLLWLDGKHGELLKWCVEGGGWVYK